MWLPGALLATLRVTQASDRASGRCAARTETGTLVDIPYILTREFIPAY